MPVSTIDPVTALVVIDLQKGITSTNAVHPVGDVIRKTRRFLQKFRVRDLPIVLASVIGRAPGRTEQNRSTGRSRAANWTDIIPRIGPETGDHCVSKSTWGTFTGTVLEDYLRARSVTSIALCGSATSIGVESTARQAHELGFHVPIATDAMNDGNADAHNNSVTTIFPRLGETGTADEIAALVDRRAP